MNFHQLQDCISPEFITKIEIPRGLDYSDIRLICGADTHFLDNCIYLGSLAGVPEEGYKNRLIGLITTEGEGPAGGGFDCIYLSRKVNLLALYEELRELWNNNNIGNIVSTLGVIFASTNINHIVNQTSRIMNNPVFLMDYSSRLLAYCCDQPIEDPDINYQLQHGHMAPQYVREMRGNVIARKLLNSPVPIMIDADGLHMTHKRLMGMIWANQRTQATLCVLECNRRLTIADSNILGNICGMLSHLVEKKSQHDRQANIMNILYESRLTALLKGEEYDLSWVGDWLAHMHWEGWQNFHLVSMTQENGLYNSAKVMELTDRLRQLAPGRCVFLQPGGIVMLVNPKTRVEFLRFAGGLEEVLPEYGICAGVSQRFGKIRELAEHCRQAEEAVRIAKLLGQKQAVCLFDRQIPYELLLTAQAQGRLKRYDDDRLRILCEYDQRCGTEYYRTLQAYLQCACNRASAARMLYINRNTMDYRINKIREMLELSDYDGEECLKLYLAYKARELEKARYGAPEQGPK